MKIDVIGKARISPRQYRAYFLALTAAVQFSAEAAYRPPKPIPDGWVAKLQMGANATRGSSETFSLSSDAKASYKSGNWENLIYASVLKSSSQIDVERKDQNGTVVTDANGEPVVDSTKNTTNDRRFLDYRLRWYWREPAFMFLKTDWETNTPASIDRSLRYIAGVGYTIYSSSKDYFTIELGSGRKRFDLTDEPEKEDTIGFFGVEFARKLTEFSYTAIGIQSDFGSDNQRTEFKASFGTKISRRVDLLIGYSSRIDSGITDSGNPLDSDADSETEIKLSIDIL